MADGQSLPAKKHEMLDGMNQFGPEEMAYRKMYKRSTAHRVFVNRNLQLEKIKFFGFDMDYTLAMYKSPNYEALVFKYAVRRLISIGYPEELCEFEYMQNFPVRGLWFDLLYGNMLKVDGFGNILVGAHGFKFMKPHEIENFYPNKFLYLNENRVFVLNTLFNLPEAYLLACIVDYFDSASEFQKAEDWTGVVTGEIVMSYQSIFQDIRSAFDWVHINSDLKDYIVTNVQDYIVKNERLIELLSRLRRNGAQTFLLTNSDYKYTNGLMRYLLGVDWTNYFDVVVVDARKPLWFTEGTILRRIDPKTGELSIGMHTGLLQQGQVYSGGSCDLFTKLVKARGKDVLYVGDHIFGDVLRSKKSRGWRTFLVVPELAEELRVWVERCSLFEQLTKLDIMIGDVYKELDSSANEKPVIDQLANTIQEVTHSMDQAYGMFGSLFRSGSRTTFFASQRYADLYASNCFNLLYYPFFYFFRAPNLLMPHELTVDHRTCTDSGHSRQQSPSAVVKEAQQVTRQFNELSSVDSRAATGGEVRLVHPPSVTTFCHEDEEDSNCSNVGSTSSSLIRISSMDSHQLRGVFTTDDVVCAKPTYVDPE